ncbi:MAG: LytTR family DNA-binding domain-containing protein [Bacteroidota bacterium]
MKVIIVEDEIPALEKLERYILKYDAGFEIVARLSSISETVNWIRNHEDGFDVAFLDIQLSDGLSFDIFNQTTINKPVIFVTAFDEYAIDAFKVNSIDYILKPITFSDVSKALNKLKNLKTFLPSNALEQTAKTFSEPRVKDRFLVKLGNHIHSIKIQDIALFYAEGRTVFLVTDTGKKFILDYNLEALSQVLDAQTFFRTNRTFIVNLNAIENVILYSNSRLKVMVKTVLDRDIIVSRERVGAFKSWFAGN